jgi:hypothetical protein
MWRLDSAKEKLQALFALVFGSPVLASYKEGVRFNPDTQANKAKLKELSRTADAARELAEMWPEIETHVAITERNYLSHSLAVVDQVRAECHIEEMYLAGNAVVDFRQVRLFPEGALASSWDQKALLDSSVASAGDCLEKLAHAGELLADLVEKTGRLEPPYVRLYTRESGGTEWTYAGIVSPLG